LSGSFGAIVEATSAPGVLSLHLNATDTFAPKSFPTRLLYNPRVERVQVKVRIEEGVFKAWDTVHDRVLSNRVTDGELLVEIDPDDAIVVVLIPEEMSVTKAHGRLVADNTVVDYAVR
jgi:hypothetical protein